MKKIESFKEYINLASRTLPDLGSEEDNSLHMKMGLETEKGEFLDVFKKFHAYKKPIDWVNVGEELADYLWYSAGLITFSLKYNKSEEYLDDLEERLKESFKELKKSFNEETVEKREAPVVVALNFYTDLGSSINDIYKIYYYCLYADLDFWQILTNNIEKLKVRFPEKFTEDKALNRDLDSERKQLEK